MIPVQLETDEQRPERNQRWQHACDGFLGLTGVRKGLGLRELRTQILDVVVHDLVQKLYRQESGLCVGKVEEDCWWWYEAASHSCDQTNALSRVTLGTRSPAVTPDSN